ncbi:hypothetical protein M3594_11980, partial [Staphylococcus capitis]|nr:hypothetical protein [Staphylococcus capitis]
MLKPSRSAAAACRDARSIKKEKPFAEVEQQGLRRGAGFVGIVRNLCVARGDQFVDLGDRNAPDTVQFQLPRAYER